MLKSRFKGYFFAIRIDWSNKLTEVQQESKVLSRAKLRRRQDIIDAAIKLFDRDGFEAARMVDIAKEAEVAKGTIYLYFENKVALLEGVVDSVIVPTINVVGEAATLHPGSAKDALKEQMKITARRMASPGMKILLRLMISSQAKHPQISQFYYDNVIKKGLKLFEETLKRGVDSGEFRKNAAEMDPLVLVGSNVYMAVWKILFEDYAPLEIDKLISYQIDIFVNGLAKQ